jgi:hypothetical protein
MVVEVVRGSSRSLVAPFSGLEAERVEPRNLIDTESRNAGKSTLTDEIRLSWFCVF